MMHQLPQTQPKILIPLILDILAPSTQILLEMLRSRQLRNLIEPHVPSPAVEEPHVGTNVKGEGGD